MMFTFAVSQRLLLFSLLFTMVACRPSGDPGPADVLRDVESYMDARPDSALAVLRAIDTLTLKNDKSRMKYNLLMAIALDKNYIDDGCFVEPMQKTVEWYERKGDQTSKMISNYYLADQFYDKKERIKAFLHFTRAYDLAEKEQNLFIEGMSARNLSELYYRTYDLQQALYYAKQSRAAFKKNNQEGHELYAALQEARELFNNGFFHKCITLCDSIINVTESRRMLKEEADALYFSADAFLHLQPKDKEQAMKRLLRIDSLGVSYTAQATGMLAYLKDSFGEKEEAKSILAQAYQLSKNQDDSIRVLFWEESMLGETSYKERYLLNKQSLDYANQALKNSVKQSIEQARSEYYRENERAATEQLLSMKNWLLLAVSVFALILILILYLIRIKKIQTRLIIQEQEFRLETEKAAKEELSNKLAVFSSAVSDTLDFGFEILNELSEKYYHPNLAKESSFRETIEKYCSDMASREELGDEIEASINVVHDGLLTKLRTEIPSLSEEEIKLFAYCVFGFSYKTINAFYPKDTSINTSYSRVFRLKKTIRESDAEDTALFLSFLNRDQRRLCKDGYKDKILINR